MAAAEHEPMRIDTVETDGMNGFQVKAVGPDGRIHLTSPSVATGRQTRV
jgi:hypothetical protein